MSFRCHRPIAGIRVATHPCFNTRTNRRWLPCDYYGPRAQKYCLSLFSSLDVSIRQNKILTVGRSLFSSIVLRHPTVSRKHSLIYAVMASPDPSNSLVFCQDLESENGTYVESRRIPRGEAVLLRHGDCVQIRHAAKIYLLQPNTATANIQRAIGSDVDFRPLPKAFHIHSRLVGQGGQAKVSSLASTLTEDLSSSTLPDGNAGCL
jgi:pSer/pThr/pTyr-binding forkhead associated (FHA) protein